MISLVSVPPICCHKPGDTYCVYTSLLLWWEISWPPTDVDFKQPWHQGDKQVRTSPCFCKKQILRRIGVLNPPQRHQHTTEHPNQFSNLPLLSQSQKSTLWSAVMLSLPPSHQWINFSTPTKPIISLVSEFDTSPSRVTSGHWWPKGCSWVHKIVTPLRHSKMGKKLGSSCMISPILHRA